MSEHEPSFDIEDLEAADCCPRIRKKHMHLGYAINVLPRNPPTLNVMNIPKAGDKVKSEGSTYIFMDEGTRITKSQIKQMIDRLHRILPKEPNMLAKDCIFRDIVIYGQSFIVGAQPVRENEIITFKHEKNNLHDAFAIKAFNKNGKPVGWVPKEISPAIARLLKDRYVVTGIAHKKPTRMWASRSDANFSCDMFAKKGRK